MLNSFIKQQKYFIYQRKGNQELQTQALKQYSRRFTEPNE